MSSIKPVVPDLGGVALGGAQNLSCVGKGVQRIHVKKYFINLKKGTFYPGFVYRWWEKDAYFFEFVKGAIKTLRTADLKFINCGITFVSADLNRVLRSGTGKGAMQISTRENLSS